MRIEKLENHGAIVSDAAHTKTPGENHGAYVSGVAKGGAPAAEYTPSLLTAQSVPEPVTLLLLGIALLLVALWQRKQIAY